MTKQERISVAEQMIADHTALSGIDDEGEPAQIGLWHLLWTLAEYTALHHIDLAAMAEEVLADRHAYREAQP